MSWNSTYCACRQEDHRPVSAVNFRGASTVLPDCACSRKFGSWMPPCCAGCVWVVDGVGDKTVGPDPDTEGVVACGTCGTWLGAGIAATCVRAAVTNEDGRARGLGGRTALVTTLGSGAVTVGVVVTAGSPPGTGGAGNGKAATRSPADGGLCSALLVCVEVVVVGVMPTV